MTAKTFTTVVDELESERQLRGSHEVFLLFAMGSQFDHLIKAALNRMGVFCKVVDPAKVHASDVRAIGPTGIIVSGGPSSANDQPPFDAAIYDLGIPLLGICLGFQMWAAHCGMKVQPAERREFGRHALKIRDAGTPLLKGVTNKAMVLQSHGDRIEAAPPMRVLAATDNAPVAAGRLGHLWGVQFHPEVTATDDGDKILHNFVFNIAGARDVFPAQDVASQKINEIRDAVAGNRVLLALSGGSDSAVVAALLQKALPGKQIRAVYIRGIDRPDDELFVKRYFGNLDLVVHDATEAFLDVLSGVYSMRDKRVAMRGVYKQVLEVEAARFGAQYIAQGTLYTDIVESGGGHASGARKAQIKLHHNAGLGFSITELTPLDDCVKDTAREIGRSLGLPEELLVRHPFPGPGIIVRIEGEVTRERLAIARKADEIYIEELRNAGLYESVWQAGAVVTQSEHTFSKGDDAGVGVVLALWAVWSVNGFTTEWAEMPYGFLREVSKRLTNEIPAVAAVVYRISDKPPATVEWG